METASCPLKLPRWASKDGPGTRKTLELPLECTLGWEEWPWFGAISFLGPRALLDLVGVPMHISHATLLGPCTQVGFGCLMAQALCVRGSLSSCSSPAAAIPASAGGDGANCDHPHPGT